MEKEENLEREKQLYSELPLLIKKIILNSMIPLPINVENVQREINEIKKITNAECESTLAYLKELGIS